MSTRTAKYLLAVAALALSGYAAFPRAAVPAEPAVVAAVAPVYPFGASVAGASGDIYVDVEVGRDGKVVSVGGRGGPEALRRAAEEAAKRWQFAPATDARQGRKVRLTFSFRHLPPNALNSDATPVFYPPYRIEVRHAIEVFSPPPR